MENKYLDYLRYNSKGELLEICCIEDKNIFINKYKISTTFQLLGKCMQLYDNEDIQSYRLKLVNYFFDIREKNNIFYYMTEKILILFPNFYDKFDIKKVTITDNNLIEFIKNDDYKNLKKVPYISNKYENILKRNKIRNTFDLFAKYLELNSDKNRMYIYLKDLGIHNNINNIVYCITEKCNILLP